MWCCPSVLHQELREMAVRKGGFVLRRLKRGDPYDVGGKQTSPLLRFVDQTCATGILFITMRYGCMLVGLV